MAPLVDDAAIPQAQPAPDQPSHQAQPATLDTLLNDNALAVPAMPQPAGLAISAFKEPCQSVVAAVPAAQFVAAPHAPHAFQFLFTVHVQVNVHFTNTLYPAGSSTQGLVIVRLLYCISFVRVVVPEFITTSQSTQLQNGRKLILASKAKASVTTFSLLGCTTSGDQPSVSVPAFTCV